MPSSGTINSASKSKIKAALPSATYKILTATVARVYAAHPDPDTWSYTGIEGGLAFVKLAATGGTGFRVVDLKVSRIAPFQCEATARSCSVLRTLTIHCMLFAMLHS